MLKIQIRGNNLSLTEVIEDYINKKSSSFEKYIDADKEAMLYVEVGKTTAHHRQGDFFRAEFNLNFDGSDLRSESEESDLYAAIDVAKDEMLEELRTKKDKGDTLYKRGARIIKDWLHRSRG